MQYTLKYSTIESCSSRQATVNIKVPTTNLTTIINQVIRFYGWEPIYAYRIASEYLKFITIRSANPQTSPSAAIDKFWHMHILNTSVNINQYILDNIKSFSIFFKTTHFILELFSLIHRFFFNLR